MNPDRNIGMVLNGRYRVHRRLGSGSHGHVYMGVQVGTERKVAIKLLRRESLEDPELEARFKREGLVMCNLKSAHTITTYDFDRTGDGTMYLVMELSNGRPLSDLIESDAPLAWRRALGMVVQMCEALAEAHAHAIVHRDLKPENILVEERPGNPDFLKILDFGIAKLLHGEPIGMDTVPKLTARGQTIGTLRYMSPEQLMGAPLDGRSDLYTLGVLAFELLTREVPFPEATKPAKLIAAQLRQDPPAPSAVHPAGRIPATVDQMVLRMLGKDPDDRFPDAQAVLQTCESILTGSVDQPVPDERHPSAPSGSWSAGAWSPHGAHPGEDEVATRARPASQPPLPQESMQRSATPAVGAQAVGVASAHTTAPVPRVEKSRPSLFWLIVIVSVGAALLAGFATWAVL